MKQGDDSKYVVLMYVRELGLLVTSKVSGKLNGIFPTFASIPAPEGQAAVTHPSPLLIYDVINFAASSSQITTYTTDT